MTGARIYCSDEALLGEGPRWLDSANGLEDELVWVDLLRGVVHRRNASGRAEPLWRADGETVSSVIALEGGGFAIAMHRAIAVLDESWRLQRTIPVDGLPAGLRLSDATAGPEGRIWLGAVPASPSHPLPGILYRMDREGFTEVRIGAGFPNGLGFSADGMTFFFVDSDAGTVEAIEHDPVHGTLGTSRLLYQHSGPGALDGMCIDEHDRAWVAVFGEGSIICIGEYGTLDRRLELPVEQVSSCVIGSERVLYATTARVELSPEQLSAQPQSGSVFAYPVDCAGGRNWKGIISS